MIYFIFHPIDGVINHFCEPARYMYEEIATVEGNTLAQAFTKAQNFNAEYAKLGNRSTCVGDIIQSTEDRQNKVCQLITGLDCKELPDTWLSYLDWGVVDVDKEIDRNTHK